MDLQHDLRGRLAILLEILLTTITTNSIGVKSSFSSTTLYIEGGLSFCCLRSRTVLSCLSGIIAIHPF